MCRDGRCGVVWCCRSCERNRTTPMVDVYGHGACVVLAVTGRGNSAGKVEVQSEV